MVVSHFTQTVQMAATIRKLVVEVTMLCKHVVEIIMLLCAHCNQSLIFQQHEGVCNHPAYLA